MYGLCIDQQGALFVTDNGNNRIQKFDHAGNFIILWGNFGAANANFHNPTGIACDAKGDVYVVDTNNHRVRRVLSQPPVFTTSPASLSFTSVVDGETPARRLIEIGGRIAAQKVRPG